MEDALTALVEVDVTKHNIGNIDHHIGDKKDDETLPI